MEERSARHALYGLLRIAETEGLADTRLSSQQVLDYLRDHRRQLADSVRKPPKIRRIGTKLPIIGGNPPIPSESPPKPARSAQSCRSSAATRRFRPKAPQNPPDRHKAADHRRQPADSVRKPAKTRQIGTTLMIIGCNSPIPPESPAKAPEERIRQRSCPFFGYLRYGPRSAVRWASLG